jgi:hypothetical protein
MKNIIFTTDREKGIEYFDNLIGNIPHKEIVKVVKSRFYTYAELLNRDTYEVRGLKVIMMMFLMTEQKAVHLGHGMKLVVFLE